MASAKKELKLDTGKSVEEEYKHLEDELTDTQAAMLSNTSGGPPGSGQHNGVL